jgi:hypothetical protein
MNRDQFAAATAGLSEAELRKALWTVYWRGTAPVRERIEDLLAPDPGAAGRRAAPRAPDPAEVLRAVREFTALARSGAYIAGNRAVRPKERSGWRFTFRRLFAESRAALAAPDPASAEVALTEMIDLGCELRGYDYFRSEDPVEAAAVVISDEVAVLWRHILERRGFAGFVVQAAEQFPRWESRFGWTRSGWGTISTRESPLTDVVAGFLTTPDTWVTFAEHYLGVLDGLAPPAPPAPPAAPARGGRRAYEAEARRRGLDRQVTRRAETMIHWHLVLLQRFSGTEEEPLLDRLAEHAALGGPEQTYFRALLAQARDDLTTARQLTGQALERLPGHAGLLALAQEIDAPLPQRARAVAESRRPPEF